jgi:hypothetical protein
MRLIALVALFNFAPLRASEIAFFNLNIELGEELCGMQRYVVWKAATVNKFGDFVI